MNKYHEVEHTRSLHTIDADADAKLFSQFLQNTETSTINSVVGQSERQALGSNADTLASGSESTHSTPTGTVKRPQQPVICPVCCQEYPSRRRLTHHVRRHTRPRSCEYTTCCKRVADQKELDRHLAKDHGHSVLTCPAHGCQKTIPGRADALLRHVRGPRHVARYGVINLNKDCSG